MSSHTTTRGLIILAVLFYGGTVIAESQPQSPAKSALGNYEQSHTNGTKKKADNNQSGTQKNPLIIEVSKTEQDDGRAYDRTKDADQKAANKRLFYITLALAIIATLQWLIYCWQACLMKRSADAARLNAEAVINAERAYVAMSHSPPGLKFDNASKQISVIVSIKNYGRTPARITAMFVEPIYSLPEVPDYPNSVESDALDIFMAAKEEIFIPKSFPIGDIIRKITTGEEKLFLCGYVDYIDVFGKHYRNGYARKYSVQRGGSDNNLIFVVKKGFNYDRPREKGKGYDWD